MPEEIKEPWLSHAALATVVFAVCATLSTFKAGSHSTLSVISQAKATDQWAYYQAKSIKEHLAESEARSLRLQRLTLPAGQPAAIVFDEQVDAALAAAARYKSEKAAIEDAARKLEAERDDATHRSKPFGAAVIFLQVAILLNSMAALFKNKRIWWLAVPVGLAGTACFADGFLRWV